MRPRAVLLTPRRTEGLSDRRPHATALELHQTPCPGLPVAPGKGAVPIGVLTVHRCFWATRLMVMLPFTENLSLPLSETTE